ncbi:hypothetical protein [Thermogemmatispora onikobensis]|uniref:hypothetical protein n=1 Tax=Thermogemmatispora onikobensis TaxID=732234 RepID=UPI00159EFEF1|nr:hypothetical protein [Thermogemmatispora onikobensis]
MSLGESASAAQCCAEPAPQEDAGHDLPSASTVLACYQQPFCSGSRLACAA